MPDFYTCIIILCLMALFVLCVLVEGNGRIEKEDRWLYYLTYTLIAVSALAEWVAIQLNGRPNVPVALIYLVKCLDYILTPMAGGILVAQMKMRNRWTALLVGILAANSVFQIIAAFFGWMITVDENHYYHHGPLYLVYILVYLAVIVLVIVGFTVYGQAYKRQNRRALYSIMVFVVLGVVLQEASGGEARTAYLSLTMAAAMMFIHYIGFSQQAADAYLEQQERLLMTDELTGVLSRHAYSETLNTYAKPEQLPVGFAVFAIDINELKKVNDSLGHSAGDELIQGAASAIGNVFSEHSRIYRTGGDEFVVMTQMNREEAEAMSVLLETETQKWSGEKVKNLYLAAGFALASDYPKMSAEALVREADKAMYAAKSQWYIRTGRDRRKNRGS